MQIKYLKKDSYVDSNGSREPKGRQWNYIETNVDSILQSRTVVMQLFAQCLCCHRLSAFQIYFKWQKSIFLVPTVCLWKWSCLLKKLERDTWQSKCLKAAKKENRWNRANKWCKCTCWWWWCCWLVCGDFQSVKRLPNGIITPKWQSILVWMIFC